eukprot:2054421-Alexandrium_andersonii.AAC.1
MAAGSLGPSGARLIGLLGDSWQRLRMREQKPRKVSKYSGALAWARMAHLRVNSRLSQSSAT